jgi:hypothetical protein
MINLRSGTDTQDPNTPAGQQDIPQEINIGEVEQPQDVRMPDQTQGIAQPTKVYIVRPARRLMGMRSPSLPRNLRPSTFAFVPQPDFESAREPSQHEEESPQQVEQGQEKKTNTFVHMIGP